MNLSRRLLTIEERFENYDFESHEDMGEIMREIDSGKCMGEECS